MKNRLKIRKNKLKLTTLGFTLIELLAVVTLISLISIIIIPNITKKLQDHKNEISEANQKLLASAADVYIENNKNYDNSYEANGSTYCISIQTLIDNNYLEIPFKDINGNEIDYTKQVQATYQAQYNSFNYEIVDNCEEIKQYVNRPNLTDNMIPVIYNETTNTWVKADKNSHWYNYSEKKWANAVLVKELKTTDASKSRDEYKEAPAGTPILDQDILAQFVWIPRYRYQLFESTSPQTINIIFENVSTEKSTGTSKNQWLTHPAFTYNNQELTGIWIGKYETSVDNNNLLIKNNTPITNIDYVEANKKIIEMTNENNIYGLKKVNTHMLRNSEWGALTYLTNSIYGDNQNNTTTNNQTGIYNIEGNKEFVIIDNENESSLGYALNETSNWTTDNSYITNNNLYLTRGNNSIYNYQNSKVIDENTTFRIALTNTEQQDQNYQRKYVVTFDPNGGTLDESQTSKEVSYHESYGALPTPTKEGYTFMGWNGKNMFELKETADYVYSTTQYTVDIENKSVIIGNNGDYEIIEYHLPTLKSNTKYTISGNATLTNINGGTVRVSTIRNTTIISDEQFLLSRYDANGQFNYKFTVGNQDETTTTLLLYGNRKSTPTIGAKVNYSYIQLEVGNTATEYEPYYITPSTPVVQEKNHTLKAIWKANE